MSENNKRIELQFYIIGWIGLIALGVFFAVVKLTDYQIFRYVPGCSFHRLTGLYCPGCGGTRSVFLLLHGKIWKSFCYHPFVPYTACLGGWFMISQTIERISRGKIKIALRFREVYLWIALALIVVNCLVKNLSLLIWHVDLLVKL